MKRALLIVLALAAVALGQATQPAPTKDGPATQPARRSLMGVKVGDIATLWKEMRSSMEGLAVPVRTGAMIVESLPGEPAYNAGIERGDIVTMVDRKRIANLAEYLSATSGLEPGTPVTLRVLKQSKKWAGVDITVSPIAPEARQPAPIAAASPDIAEAYRQGEAFHAARVQYWRESVREHDRKPKASSAKDAELDEVIRTAAHKMLDMLLADKGPYIATLYGASSKVRDEKAMEVGQIGRIQDGAVVLQVTGDKDLILKLHRSGDLVWLHGLSTAKVVDGEKMTIKTVLKVVGTKRYETVDGGSKTIYQLDPIDPQP